MITQDLQKKHREITMNMDEKQKYKLAIQELQKNMSDKRNRSLLTNTIIQTQPEPSTQTQQIITQQVEAAKDCGCNKKKKKGK